MDCMDADPWRESAASPTIGAGSRQAFCVSIIAPLLTIAAASGIIPNPGFTKAGDVVNVPSRPVMAYNVADDDTWVKTTQQGEKTMSDSYQGACFCGAVELRVTGKPNAMGYCHCRSCQSWSGGPVNAFTLWAPEAVEVTKGADDIATFQKTEMSHRQFCKRCGGHLMTVHPPLKMIDVFAATIPGLAFVPAVHVNYAETVLPMRDGLPKLKDFPAEFGGSGEVVPE